jgi:iron complex outermembrane receptor protein
LLAAEQASSVRAYNLPAAPLATTLNQIASQAGLALSLNPSLAAGKTSAPVNGQYDAPAPCVKRCAAPACNWSKAAPAPTAWWPCPKGHWRCRKPP